MRTHQLNYKGRINDMTGRVLQHGHTGAKQVVTSHIYDPNENRTTLVLEFVEEK